MTDGVHIRLTLTRGVKVTSGMDPAPEPVGPDADRPRRAQASGVLEEGPQPGHEQPAPLAAGLASTRRFIMPTCSPRSSQRSRRTRQARTTRSCWICAGFIAETNATHLFMVHAGVVRTPTLAACPEGITRSTVLDICRAEKIPHEVADLSLTELYRADEAFCTGTMGELAGVTQVDGRTIGNGSIGPMTERLSALYSKRTASGRHDASWTECAATGSCARWPLRAVLAAGCATQPQPPASPPAPAAAKERCGTASRSSQRAATARRCGFAILGVPRRERDDLPRGARRTRGAASPTRPGPRRPSQAGDLSALPPAVVMDIDETVLDNSEPQAEMLLEGICFDEFPAAWDAWVAKRSAPGRPGRRGVHSRGACDEGSRRARRPRFLHHQPRMRAARRQRCPPARSKTTRWPTSRLIGPRQRRRSLTT